MKRRQERVDDIILTSWPPPVCTDTGRPRSGSSAHPSALLSDAHLQQHDKQINVCIQALANLVIMLHVLK